MACEAGQAERREAAHPELLGQLAEVLLSTEAAQQVATELPFSPVAGPCLQALLLAIAADRWATAFGAWCLMRGQLAVQRMLELQFRHACAGVVVAVVCVG